jgi:hypothetical protein
MQWSLSLDICRRFSGLIIKPAVKNIACPGSSSVTREPAQFQRPQIPVADILLLFFQHNHVFIGERAF